MKKVILTGNSIKESKEIIKKEEHMLVCYLCKRTTNDEGIFISKNGDFGELGTTKLVFLRFEVNQKGMNFEFCLCHECSLLIDGISTGFANKVTI